MIEVKTTKGASTFTGNGSPLELIDDALHVILCMYEGMKKQDEFLGMLVKNVITEAVAKGIVFDGEHVQEVIDVSSQEQNTKDAMREAVDHFNDAIDKMVDQFQASLKNK